MNSFVLPRLDEIILMRKNFLTWSQIKEVLSYPGDESLLSSAFYRVTRSMNIEVPKTKCITDKYDQNTVEQWRDLTYSQIHLMTGLSFVSVIKLCNKYGVSIKSGKVSKPRINKDEVIALSEELTEKEIAIKLGCSLKTVKKILETGKGSLDNSDLPMSSFLPKEVRSICLGKWK